MNEMIDDIQRQSEDAAALSGATSINTALSVDQWRELHHSEDRGHDFASVFAEMRYVELKEQEISTDIKPPCPQNLLKRIIARRLLRF